MEEARRRRALAAAVGVGLGLAAAAGVLAATSAAVVGGAPAAPPAVEASHLPPLLTAAGEGVTLRYDIYCVGADATAGCDAAGTVYARSGEAGPFVALPLRLDPDAVDARYAARVPDALVRSGFSYYAVLRDRTSGASTRIPADGLEQSLPIGRPAAVVSLGRHVFGNLRAADARVASAGWGDGPGEVGLEEQGPDATPIGGASFDVDPAGRVTLLDEAHRRLLRWLPGGSRAAAVPVAVRGIIGDIASGADGTTYVLESPTDDSPARLRGFDPGGREVSSVEVGRSAAALRAGGDGPVVLEPETGRWFGSTRGPAPAVGRPVGAGLRGVAYRPDAGELRLALVNDAGTVTRAWQITSSTPIGEVQLAEVVAGRLIAVMRLYEERRAEFVTLVLGPRGVERQFSTDAADWAETAPLARFRLGGGSLYRLGSTPAGVFVDRYDLGVN